MLLIFTPFTAVAVKGVFIYMKQLLLISLSLFSLLSYSQNLIYNSKFEEYSICPTTVGELNKLLYWSNPTNASPDYFNSCNNGNVGVPNNIGGFQDARSGIAYVGIVAFYPNGYREYIQGEFVNPLTKGEIYCVTFYVSLAEGSKYGVNNLAAFFSNIAINDFNTTTHLPYNPQIKNLPSIPLTNMNDWQKVEGSFMAEGNEMYITIGNFFDNSSTSQIFVHNPPSGYEGSFYYIDDVSVIHLSASAGRDTAICMGSNVTLGRAASTGLTYSWQPAIGLDDPTKAQPIATPTQTTTYILTATLDGGCSKIDSVTVVVVNADAGRDTTICIGESVTIGSAPDKGNNYSWQPIQNLTDANASQTTATPYTTTTYNLTASANGCTKTDNVTITVLPYRAPTANAGEDKIICKGEEAKIGTLEVTGLHYSWSPLVDNPNSSTLLVKPKETTVYYLTVTDTASSYLCKEPSTNSITITVEDCAPEIPNVFTPNGDGLNELFFIKNLNEESTVSIFNRWGTEVFSSTGFSHFWDGRTPGGEQASEGIYFYIVEHEGKVYKGYLHLMK